LPSFLCKECNEFFVCYIFFIFDFYFDFAASDSLVRADFVLVAWYATLPAAFMSPELLSGSTTVEEEVTLLLLLLPLLLSFFLAAAFMISPELYRLLAMLSTCGCSCMFENVDINDCI
jgi:hypothetical protein